MARQRIKLAHEREILRLKTAKMQARIAIQDHRDRIKEIQAKLDAAKPPKPSSTSN